MQKQRNEREQMQKQREKEEREQQKQEKAKEKHLKKMMMQDFNELNKLDSDDLTDDDQSGKHEEKHIELDEQNNRWHNKSPSYSV